MKYATGIVAHGAAELSVNNLLSLDCRTICSETEECREKQNQRVKKIEGRGKIEEVRRKEEKGSTDTGK
jgi:hypothetical protein